MRFAIATIDRYLGVFETLVEAGWTPLKLFSFPSVDGVAHDRAVTALAQSRNVAVQDTRITEADLRDLGTLGCDVLIVACYPWRIGPWQPFFKYAVNFHCSPLPEGRGPYPLHRVILEKRNEWAVTCQRLAADFDTGEILVTERFPLQPDECHETLDLKVQMAAKRLAGIVAAQFVDLWDRATPQATGSYWPQATLTDRTIAFDVSVEVILRHIRAYGLTESLAPIGRTWLVIRRATGWVEPHDQVPGQVVHVNNRTVVFAASDGYIAVLDGNLAPPAIAAELDQTAHGAAMARC